MSIAPTPEQVPLFMLRALKAEGIDHLFLVPGTTLDPFLPHFETVGIKPIIAAKEDGAAYMADGYGRSKRHFGVCMGIGGPGATNMVTPIAAAYSDRTRVLAIAGAIPFAEEGEGAFHDSTSTNEDDHLILNPITAFSQVIPTTDRVPVFLSKAIQAMHGVENRPAFLAVPIDLQEETLAAEYTPVSPKESARILDHNLVARVPELLKNATHVVLYLGNGVVLSEASEAVRDFANRYQLPVVTTTRAKGAISEQDPMSFGVFGLGGSMQANKVIMGSTDLEIPSAEVQIVLGATLNEINTHGWAPQFPPTQAMIQVDINPNNITGKEYGQFRVMGDVRTFIEWLEGQESVKRTLNQGVEARKRWMEQIRKTPYYDTDEDRLSNNQPIHPARVLAELRQVSPADSVLVCDSGAHSYFTAHHWTSYAPNEFLLLSTTGPMGYAISMGIGAKMARPDQPVVCVLGDGSMLMHGMELHTAARYQVPMVIVVINNSSLANVYLNLESIGAGTPSALEMSHIPTRDWAQFAKSLGADGEVVEDPSRLAEVFTRAFAANGPFVVDVRCDHKCQTPNE